jgi:CRISPR-associated protein Cmr3
MAPSDALLMGDGSTLHMRRLEPIADARGCTNLPVKDPAHPAIAAEGLMPVGISPRGNASDDRSKPNESDGIYWHWDFFAKWLSNPVDNSPVPPSAIMGALPRDVRTHVQIDASTGTVGDEGGKLFSTQGLNFRRQGRRFGIGVDVSSEIPNQPMVGSLGGERRLVSWHLSEGKFPALSEDLVKTIVSRKHCRVILLTPAYFTQGWYPELLLARNYNVQPTLLAAATGRAQILSGWDMAKGRPKPSTRYMGAGSVFYLKLAGSDADITTWVNKVWFQNISDQEQSQRDGFGLAVVGAW